MRDGITIVICCFNGESRIEETLKFVFALKIPDQWNVEVLVINNNSTDATALVAEKTAEKFKGSSFRFEIVDEVKPGLTVAREKGIRLSRYDLVLFCDDDNHLDSEYLIHVRQLFRENPTAGIVGGWCRPKFQSDPGKWIEDFYGALAVEKYPRKESIVRSVFGAGMVIRKDVLTNLKSRSIKLMLSDRLGKNQTSGGDTELCLLARFIEYDVYYSPKLILDHAVVERRLTKKNFIKNSTQNFYGVMVLFLLDKIVYEEKRSSFRLFWSLFSNRVYNIFHFFPRCILGNHQFYSLISAWANICFSGWLIFNFFNFGNTLKLIKSNLKLQ